MIVRQQLERGQRAICSCLFLQRAESADRTGADAVGPDTVSFW